MSNSSNKGGRKRLGERGAMVILPIVGDVCAELRISTHRMPTLILRDSAGDESQMEFEEAVTLLRGDCETRMEGSRPGVTLSPKELGPLLDLLGEVVTDARATRTGTLEIEFSNDWLLRVEPESGFEALHFQYPRVGQQPGGDVTDHISLHGDAGRLA